MNASDFIFKKYGANKKKSFINSLTDTELRCTSYTTIERCLKEAGNRINEHHTPKRLYLDRNIASNHWNSNIKYIDNSKKEILLEVYIQGEDTDTEIDYKLKDFLRGYSIIGSFEESYLNGYSQRIIARYDDEDRANVIKAILLAYVEQKAKKNEK